MAMKRLLSAVSLLTVVACAAPEPPPSPVSAEFLAKPLVERQLAVYDAYWSQLESNYYDPEFFKTGEWPAVRAQWREKAASAPRPLQLYLQVLNPLSALMPESHVSAEPYVTPTPPKAMYGKYPAKKIDRLAVLLFANVGLTHTELRRGAHRYPVVAEVESDSQAADAGIAPGWRVISATGSMDIDRDAVRFSGEFVPLDPAAADAWEQGKSELAPPDPSSIVKIAFDYRQPRNHAPIESRTLKGGITYLRFDGFGDEAFMKPVLAAIRDAGDAGLIIDLRGNSGGYMTQMQAVAGALLGDGPEIGTQSSATTRETWHGPKGSHRYQGPLAVLVGPLSASASEIVAAAVQDNKRGLIIGRMTNGSVLSAQPFPLPDGGHVIVPTHNVTRVTGQRIEGIGVTPDIRVMPTLEDVRAGRDPVVARAMLELARRH
jgi:carboxyl-terminal processing protease